MFLRRMAEKLPFGPREKRIFEILVRYFQEHEKKKNVSIEEKEEFHDLALTFLTDIRGYGAARQRVVVNLKNFFKSVFCIRPPRPLIDQILRAYRLISEASNNVYRAVLTKIFTPTERKILALLNLTSSFTGWENHKLVPVLGLQQNVEFSLSLWTQLGVQINAEQKDLILYLCKQ